MPTTMPSEPTMKKEFLSIFVMALFFIIIHGLALLVIGPFQAAGVEPAFENPDDPMNLVIFFGIIMVMTLLILLIAKFWKKQLIQIIILGAVGYTSFFILFPLFSLIIIDLAALVLAIAIAVLLVVALFKYPEWYVVDITCILVGAGAIALFGISLSILLVILLLIVLAVYDAISVYKTKHMVSLAETVVDLKLPVLLVVPKIKSYSLIKESKTFKEKLKEGTERDAFFMGLGDVVMPGILVVSTYHSIENGLPIALSVTLGTLLGFLALMTFVLKGKPQAGLPLLCTGAILGYVVSSFVLYGTLQGLSLPF